MKIRIKCSRCSWTTEMDVRLSPLGSLRPDDKAKGFKVKISKEQLDRIMETAQSFGASREELAQIGVEIPIPEWEEAEERARLRAFVRENLKISKEPRKTEGERSQVSTAPWEFGDSFKEIDLPSSEVKSLGVEDLRLIPGVTLQKRLFEVSKGTDKEILKGIKFFYILDVSGSMFTSSYGEGKPKITKALMMARECYRICKKMDYEYNLAIFSDKARRIAREKVPPFFGSLRERSRYPEWQGGTLLSRALELYTLEELKDSNLVIVSDMDLADLDTAKDRLKEISSVTNSFKVILVEAKDQLSDERVEQTQSLFPDRKVQILKVGV